MKDKGLSACVVHRRGLHGADAACTLAASLHACTGEAHPKSLAEPLLRVNLVKRVLPILPFGRLSCRSGSSWRLVGCRPLGFGSSRRKRAAETA